MAKIKVIELKVERLDKKNFEPYGEIIGPQKGRADLENEDIAFYAGLSSIEVTKQGGMFSWMDVRRQRKFICENLERHINCTECIIPIDGSSICVVTLSENMEDPKSPLSLESMKAFFMDGSLAINLKKAVWHWIPYPLSEKASFILVLGKETPKKDLEIIDLKKDYNLSVKLILEK